MMSNINTTGISSTGLSGTGMSNTSSSEVKGQTSQNVQPVSKKQDAKGEDQSNKGVASAEELSRTVEDLNNKLANEELRVSFSMDKDSNHFVVKIHDKATGELVRQIPSEETLKFAKNVEKGIGIIVDSEF